MGSKHIAERVEKAVTEINKQKGKVTKRQLNDVAKRHDVKASTIAKVADLKRFKNGRERYLHE